VSGRLPDNPLSPALPTGPERPAGERRGSTRPHLCSHRGLVTSWASTSERLHSVSLFFSNTKDTYPLVKDRVSLPSRRSAWAVRPRLAAGRGARSGASRLGAGGEFSGCFGAVKCPSRQPFPRDKSRGSEGHGRSSGRHRLRFVVLRAGSLCSRPKSGEKEECIRTNLPVKPGGWVWIKRPAPLLTRAPAGDERGSAIFLI